MATLSPGELRLVQNLLATERRPRRMPFGVFLHRVLDGAVFFGLVLFLLL